MLKPKRKITKKEIRHDPLLEIVYSAQRFYDKHKNRIILAVLALVIIVSAVLIVSRKKASVRIESDIMLAQALSQIEKSSEETLAIFDNLLRMYPETEASTEAHFHMARMFFSLDSLEAARVNFEMYLELAPNGPFSSASMSQLASIALYNDEPNLAGDLFERAEKISSSQYISSISKLNAVEAWIAAGEYSRAEEILLSISDNPALDNRVEALKTKISLHYSR